MFKIVRCPVQLEPFFEPLKARFLWSHFHYFQLLVLAMAVAYRRHNVSALYRCLDEKQYADRSRFNNFFLVGRWDAAEALREKAYELLGTLNPQPGETVELIFDDTKKQKRGKRMEAVAKIFDPVAKQHIDGHQYVQATLRFRGFLIPFAVRLYVSKKNCAPLGLKFKKSTEMVAEMIRECVPPSGVHVRVLFDSYYLCPTVVAATREKGFRFISTGKDNRNLFQNGRKLKAGEYGKTLFRRGRFKRAVNIKEDGGKTVYEYADAGWLDVSGLGRLHVVFSRRKGDQRAKCLITDDAALAPRETVIGYTARFFIEVFFKDAKQLLGLGQYQNRSYRAAVTHLHLVCFAYALLTHVAIRSASEKGKRKKLQAVHLSTERYQNDLRRIVWRDLAQHLRERPDAAAILKELDRLLLAS